MRPGQRPDAEEFACSFWIPFRSVTAALLLLTPILAALIENPHRQWTDAPLAFLGALTFATVPIAFGVWWYRVDTDAAGIGGYNGWNVYGRLPWDRIERVRRVTLFPGLCYLRIAPPKGGPVIWLPLFLLDMDRFRKVVVERAPSDSPLRAILDSPQDGIHARYPP